ncbi:hypothetical protein HPB47_023895 [Ixodes persulcatus]|uniref:Uncharacterized protein n=1 Tax=Ixodes persulcatus TaxID=34615 RepID=A0AC60Q847_IXOPE|nr:hypothetical protein HPB47_023895 [Ixodes persulcatus]
MRPRFNPSTPNCKGNVTKNMVKSPKGPRPWMMCGTCHKRTLKLRGLPLASPSFARIGSLGHPVKLAKAEIIWLIFAKSHELDTQQTRQLVDGLFDMGAHVQADWFNYVRGLLGKGWTCRSWGVLGRLSRPTRVSSADIKRRMVGAY